MQQFVHIHGGNIAQAAKKYGLPKERIIDFSANINPLGFSRNIYDAITSNLDAIINYPDPDCIELKEVLAGYLGIDRDLLLMGNGAAELIYLIVRITGCKKALIPVPTFCEYGLAVLSQGGEVIEVEMVEEERFSLPVERIINLIPQVDLLFICNPNNPTGRLVERAAIEQIIERSAKHGVLVVIDEAFMDFVPKQTFYSMMPAVGSCVNLVVLYSLTKFFGIPGLRLGSIAAPKDIIKRINAAKDPWNVNALAQVAGIAGLKDLEHMERTNTLVKREKAYLFEELQNIPGLRPLPGAANFILLNVSESGLKSNELTELLGRRGILVRDCHGFSGLAGRYIRVAIKNRPENEILLRNIKDVLKGK
ncbi:MAG: threonine-phosphate decarboxylase CobD [Desulfotomaculaceae bacterium]|nr:threonine-phosphate decarboxylase CobD [Desulfotomaculaceae bacterium]MDD4767303.1 threonine-phosphate decarboxylase CobD [Desulfotomaculaceae bacterium]